MFFIKKENRRILKASPVQKTSGFVKNRRFLKKGCLSRLLLSKPKVLNTFGIQTVGYQKKPLVFFEESSKKPKVFFDNRRFLSPFFQKNLTFC
jgi:hypothetical protein